MIAVADSSPLITLSRAHQLDLLREFYVRVTIPRQVYEEVAVAGAGKLFGPHVLASEAASGVRFT